MFDNVKNLVISPVHNYRRFGGTDRQDLSEALRIRVIFRVPYYILQENNAVHQIMRNKLMPSQINANSETGFQNGGN